MKEAKWNKIISYFWRFRFLDDDYHLDVQLNFYGNYFLLNCHNKWNSLNSFQTWSRVGVRGPGRVGWGGGGWAKGSSAPPIFAHTHFRCLPNRLVYRLTQISLVGRRWRQCDQIWWNSATLDKFWTSLATFEGLLGCGGGQVVRVLAVYSDDPSSKPADANSFSVKFCLKRMKINQKDAGVGPFNITFEGLNFK